jgi:transposase
MPVEVRQRVIRAYREGISGSYAETARLFSVAEASVSRWLRRDRAGESLAPQWGGGPKRRVDLEWLRDHVAADEDARIIDRIAAWDTHSGVRVSIGAMWGALHAIGMTHKKRRR